MPVCDICNADIRWEDGYVLTTQQVAANEAYWEAAFKGPWSYTHSMDPAGETLAILVQQQASQSSGWLACEECSQLFTFDRSAAKSFAEGQVTVPPGSGPASVADVALAAANVWNKLYGEWPSSIKRS
jgi:hypothetical protein